MTKDRENYLMMLEELRQQANWERFYEALRNNRTKWEA